MKSGEKREEEIFREAIRRAEGRERKAFLDQACDGDRALRERLEALLQAHETPNPALECLPDLVSGIARRLDIPVEEGPGTRIGRYKLLEKIGEGGMGVVYMADQEEPVRRRVALKIIKLGMDTKQVIARFEAERQALALMDHPNIARVLDGGATETGRPYFVMELVHGVPITEFCDKNRLSAQERLKLFISVCQAIQSAHQKGIIHRDIKPTNVMVTLHHGEPMPKVIDFGVAKATDQKLTEKTLFTHYGTMIGTPAYMSPEQAEMSSMDVDTRSDLYSLGVLLYELLTGTTPFPEKRLRSLGYREMQRVILEEEPERPSKRLSTMNQEQKTAMVKSRGEGAEALGELLKGDLDWIVMKCLEKDRRRRYESASGLVADIERHFSNEPVLARPPSAAYRLSKAIQRNKGAFLAAAAIVITLLVGIIVSVSQAIRATNAERQQATLRAEAERTAEKLREENYAADMHLACNALDGGLPGQARAIVERHRPQTTAIPSNTANARMDLRGWEWRHLWQQTRPVELVTFLKQELSIHSMALSSGDKPLLASVDAEQLNIWDFKKRDKLKSLAMPAYGRGIVFSPDGKWLACGGDEVRVWDMATWNLKQRIRNDAVAEVAFSPDSRLLAGASISRVRVWSMTTFEELASLPAFYDFNFGATACGLAFSPDGRTLAYGISNNLIQLWDTVSKSPKLQLAGHTGSVNTLCFSPDGGKLVSGAQGPDSSFVRVYDLRSSGDSKELMRADTYSFVARTRFSPDGKRLAVASGMTIQIYNTESWEEIIAHRGHGGGVWDLDFSSDGKWLASSGEDGTIRIWDGKPVTPEPDEKVIPPGVKGNILSPGGETLLTIYSNSTFSLWNTATLREGPHQPFPGAISELSYFDRILCGTAVAPEGKRIAYVRDDGMLAVWDVDGQREMDFLVPRTNQVGCIRFSHDGNSLVFANNGGHDAEVWDVMSKTKRLSFRIQGTILSFDFSRDGTQLAVGTDDSYGEVWSLTQQCRTAQFEPKHARRRSVTQIVLSNNGRLAATVGYENRVRLWDLQTQQEIWTAGGELNGYHSISFSSDDSLIAASALSPAMLPAAGGMGAIKVMRVRNGEEVASIQSLPGMVSFLPDGNTLILLHADSRLRRFRAAPFAETDAVDKNERGNGR